MPSRGSNEAVTTRGRTSMMKMRSCSMEIDSPAVIASVMKQVEEAFIKEELPETMILKPSMKEARLDDAIMVELEINRQEKTVHEGDVLPASEMIRKNSGSVGSICYVTRRPGCSFCREQALTLSVLAALHRECLEGFQIFGVVKETQADQEGLTDFSSTYFNGLPIYCDNSYAFYRALGYRRVGISNLLNRLSIWSILCETLQHITSKQVDGNIKGEGIVQGGLVFFDKHGNPYCAYEEETGVDLRIEDILTAVNMIRKQSSESISSGT